MDNLERDIAAFRAYVKKIMHYEHALNVLHWDHRTMTPANGMEERSNLIGLLSGEHFQLTVSEEMEAHLSRLNQPEILPLLDEVTRGTLLECQKEFDQSRRIPVERYQEFVVLTSQAETVWEVARSQNDFAMYLPYLEKIIAMQLEFIDYWRTSPDLTRYDVLLDLYEPGMTARQLDEIFDVIRKHTVPLVAAISEAKNKPELALLTQHFPADKQEALSLWALQQIGYDFEAGRLDISTHPFCTSFSKWDVRMTTAYVENDFRAALYSTMHEAGHAMYEQQLADRLADTPLCDGTSMGIHESQSRFWENVIGRSRSFCRYLFPEAKKLFPNQFKEATTESFYRAINLVEPSLIRIDADEVTYNLHIMIRYELEKGLIDQSIAPADLPGLWNEKVRQYLGIEVPSDAMGVLQDPHWAGGSFGYFPTYSLGNVYSAQFLHTMKKQLPHFDQLVEKGEFTPIRQWLADHIYQYGKLKTPAQLLMDVTGEEVNATYLVTYLQEKYKDIYHL